MSSKALVLCLIVLPLARAIAAPNADAVEKPVYYECAKVKGGKYADKECSKAAESKSEEKYELEPGGGKGKAFRGNAKGKVTIFIPHFSYEMTCGSATEDEGVVAANGASLEQVVIRFSGCDNGCGSGKGEIVTTPLKGELGVLSGAKVGVLLSPESGEKVAEYGCGGDEAFVTYGSILAEVVGGVNVFSKEQTLVFTVNGHHEQEWTRFEGALEEEVLKTEINGSGRESQGVQQEITQKGEFLNLKT